MIVFVRKLSNRRNVKIIQDSISVENISADVVSDEFKTKKSTLSVWETTDDNIDLGVLAILLSSEHLDTMDFVILNKNTVENNGLSVVESDAESNPLKQATSIHRDICNLQIQDIPKLATVYKDAVSDEANIIRYTTSQIKLKIEQAVEKGWVDSSKVSEDIKKKIDALVHE
jgi:hypothetical protein